MLGFNQFFFKLATKVQIILLLNHSSYKKIYSNDKTKYYQMLIKKNFFNQ